MSYSPGLFQSTCPARGTTKGFVVVSPASWISIHVPREGHDVQKLHAMHKATPISIHVPREGHDLEVGYRLPLFDVISIHVPREGHDAADGAGHSRWGAFQSTCPARGTTGTFLVATMSGDNFNPRAPRGARRFGRLDKLLLIAHFNPRAPRGARRRISATR